MNLIFKCESYLKWPKHAVEDLITILDWENFSPNTSKRFFFCMHQIKDLIIALLVLTTEGYRSPFMGFIQKGTCHVLRKVDVIRKDENGKPTKRMKQVVIGKIKENDSFGEVSVILKEPMTCSIVTETECRIGIIQYEKIYSKSLAFFIILMD